MIDVSGVWNTTGTPTLIKANVTDTASNANSLLMDLQVGGSSRFRVDKSGNIRIANLAGLVSTGSFGGVYVYNDASTPVFFRDNGGTQRAWLTSTSFAIASTYAFSWSFEGTNFSYPDLFVYRDAANTLAQRNSTNAQTFRVYNTYSSATSYENLQLQWSSNEARIGTSVGSTGGTQRNLVLGAWNSAGTWTAGLTMTPAGAITTGLQLTNALGTITTSQPLTLTQTWNNAAVTFTGILANVTDTASNANSLLMDLQVGGSSIAKISKSGRIDANGIVLGWIGNGSTNLPGISFDINRINFTTDAIGAGNARAGFHWDGVAMSLIVGADGYLGMGGGNNDPVTFGGRVRLYSDAANTFAQRNSTNAQIFRIYNTFTSATSFERARLEWASNVFILGPESGSAGGSVREMSLRGGLGVGTNVAGGQLTIRGGQGTGTGAGGAIVFETTPAGSSGSSANTSTERLRIDSTGLSTFPGAITCGNAASSTAQLTVKGGAVGGPIIALERTVGVNLAFDWSLAGSKLTFRNTTVGRTACQMGADNFFASTSDVTIGIDEAGTADINGGQGLLKSADSGGAGNNKVGGNLIIVSGRGNGTGTPSSISIRTPTLAASGTTRQAWVERILINNSAVTVSSQLSITNITASTSTTTGACVVSGGLGVAGAIHGGSSLTLADDAILIRDAANALAQRNSTSAQTFRLYNTFTSATSFERAKLEWASNVFRIGTEKGSAGGSARAMEFQTDGTTRLTIGTSGTVTSVETVSTPSGTTQTVNLGAGNHQTLDLGSASGNVTVTLTVPSSSSAGTLILLQGATVRNVTWTPSAGSIIWMGGEPTWSSDTANTSRIIAWRYNGTNLRLAPSEASV